MGRGYIYPTHLEAPHMTIGIDCRLSGKAHAGLGRYTENLIREILSTDKKTSYVLFFFDTIQANTVLGTFQNADNVRIVIAPVKHYSLREQLQMPWYYYTAKLDLLHVPHFNVALLYFSKTVVTIHDLLWHEKRGSTVTTLSPMVYWLKYAFYHIVTRVAVSRSATVLVPSKTVKKTVLKHYPFAKEKIKVTQEGTHLTTPKKVPKRKQQQLLYVGSLYPHKNIRLVIDALKQLPKTSLVIIGSRNNFQKKVEQYVKNRKLQQRVSFLGYVSDSTLTQQYLQATALVQPSFSEGFGLTGLEALSLQTPILVSDIPIFREVYKDAATYFDPHSIESFISGYKKIQKQSVRSFKKRAEHVAASYSWKKMAKETLAVYRSSS